MLNECLTKVKKSNQEITIQEKNTHNAAKTKTSQFKCISTSTNDLQENQIFIVPKKNVK